MAIITPFFNKKTPSFPWVNTSMLCKKIELKTMDVTDPNNKIIINETYVVNCTNSTLSPKGNAYFLRFGSSEYGLTFYFPSSQITSPLYNKVYMTYSSIDYRYSGGYKNYVSVIPKEYLAAFTAWFNSIGNTGVVRDWGTNSRQRKISFSFNGAGPSSNRVNTIGVFSFGISLKNKSFTTGNTTFTETTNTTFNRSTGTGAFI